MAAIHLVSRSAAAPKEPPTLHAPPRAAPKKPKRKVDTRGRAKIRVNAQTLAVIDNPASVTEWDDEELKRGQRRDKNGSFTGRPPSVLPREIHIEIQRRHIEKAASYFVEHAQEMATVLFNIAKNPEQDAKARVAAAKIMLDRALGAPTTTTKMDVSVHEPKYLAALRDGIVSGDDEDDDIVDAELVD